MARRSKGSDVPPKHPGHDSIHGDEGDSKIDLRYADELASAEINKLAKRVDAVDERSEENNKLLNQELRSSRRNFWVAVITIGGLAAYLYDYRESVTEMKLTMREQQLTMVAMQKDMASMKESSIVTSLSIEQIQKEGSLVPALEMRVRELERALDRMKTNGTD